MEKKQLLLIPFIIGLTLFVYSWYLSYPLSVNAADDFVYNNVSVLYWFSVPLLLGSMFLMAVLFKNPFLKWIFSVGCILTIYSLAYFYAMVPGADSRFFRGLTESFINTGCLDPARPGHDYYQWPSYFILGNVAPSVSGLALPVYEFLLYTLIGSLIATCLYLYASKKYGRSGFLMTVAFFIPMFYFFNFQAVPFTLAFGILLLLFVLDIHPKSKHICAAMAILYTGLLLTHAFVPLFLVIYFLFRGVIDRSKQYVYLFLFSLVGYLVIQLTLANFSFTQNIFSIFTKSGEYTQVVAVALLPVQVPIDKVAQIFSRLVTISALLLCCVGFLFMLAKKALGATDKAILLLGIFYSGLGVVLFTLGTRAIPIAFIPISLGAVYLLKSRFKRYFVSIFLVLLLLFVFIPLHQSFYNEVQFHTKDTYLTENFFIDHYQWEDTSLVLANYRVIKYVDAKAGVEERLFTSRTDQVDRIDAVLYTVGLSKDFYGQNYTITELFQDVNLNVLCDDGDSFIAVKADR